MTPFSLPLNREQFASALRVGHGRAVMHIRRHGIDGLEDLLIDACLHNRTYDPQCEGSRKQWLVGMLDLAGIDEEQLLPVLLPAIKDEDTDYSDMELRIAIAGIYAARGNRQAKEAIYAAADAQAAEKDEPSGAVIKAVIEMDDFDGLCFIAERSGRWMSANQTAARSLYPTGVYDDIHGEGAAMEALRAAAADNKWIALFVERPDPIQQSHERDSSSRRRWPRKQLLRATAEEIINSIETGEPEFSVVDARHWGQHACGEDVLKIAERLLATSDAKHLVTYLRILAVRALPEFDERLLGYLEHPHEYVHSNAARAVASNQHPAVRSMAFELARCGKHDQSELRLFINNYEPGDWRIIRESLHLSEDDEELHGTVFDLLAIFEANPLPEALEPLLLAYEYMPCSICRTKAVEQLVDLDLAPAWLIEEYQDDSYGTDDDSDDDGTDNDDGPDDNDDPDGDTGNDPARKITDSRYAFSS